MGLPRGRPSEGSLEQAPTVSVAQPGHHPRDGMPCGASGAHKSLLGFTGHGAGLGYGCWQGVEGVFCTGDGVMW